MSPIDQFVDWSIYTRRLFRAWLIFATAALTLAAFFVVPAALRISLGGKVLSSVTTGRFLVGHIFFSLVLASMAFLVVLWMHAVLWVATSRFPVVPAWMGFWLAVAGSGLATTSVVAGWGEPVLAAFVPMVIEPVFLSGFVLFVLGIAVTTGCFIYAITSVDIGRMPLIPFGMLCTAFIMIAAGFSGVATVTRLFGDWFAFQLAWQTPSILAQALFWGPGHLIPFATVGAMVVSWTLLLPHPGLSIREESLARSGFLVLVVFAAVVLIVLYAVDPLALPKMTALNIALRGLMTLPVIFLGSLVLGRLLRLRLRSKSQALFLSILLFAAGLLMAAAGIGQPTQAWVPSHYEAMIPGAVLTAFMGVSTELIPLWDQNPTSEPLERLQVYFYAGGVFLVSVAMLWAAWLGGERRGYFIAMPEKGPMVLLWIGAIAAEIGVLAFAAHIVGALVEGGIQSDS